MFHQEHKPFFPNKKKKKKSTLIFLDQTISRQNNKVSFHIYYIFTEFHEIRRDKKIKCISYLFFIFGV